MLLAKAEASRQTRRSARGGYSGQAWRLLYNKPMSMIIDFAVLLLIAGVCGFVASQLMGAKRMNIVTMIVLGFVGAIVGRWLAAFFHMPLLYDLHIGGHYFPLVWAMIGSILTIGVATFFMQH
jgi:uncharacterized membrane protein YeaQ/YmgE (transglycosylase-associated protein family)